MTDAQAARRRAGIRLPPPPFLRAEVADRSLVTPHLMRVHLVGSELADLAVAAPAASVRLLLPEPGHALAIPEWNGNQFLAADGSRPTIRTLTPLPRPPGSHHLDLDVVLHDDSPLTVWVRTAAPDTEVAVSGPGRGFTGDPDAGAYLIAGDESAIPAVRQVLDAIAPTIPVVVHIEVSAVDAEAPLPNRDTVVVAWHVREAGERHGDPLLRAVSAESLTDDTMVWAAGEAAAMHRLRKHLAECGLPRSSTTVRGYWKRNRNPV